MQFDTSPRALDLRQQLQAVMDEHVYPNEAEYVRQVETGKP